MHVCHSHGHLSFIVDLRYCLSCCRFVVLGSTKNHYTVTLSDDRHACQCVDFRIRKHECKHIRCALEPDVPSVAFFVSVVCSERVTRVLTSLLLVCYRLVLTQLDIADNPSNWHEVTVPFCHVTLSARSRVPLRRAYHAFCCGILLLMQY